MPHVFTHAEYADTVFFTAFVMEKLLLRVENTVYGFLTSQYQTQEYLQQTTWDWYTSQQSYFFGTYKRTKCGWSRKHFSVGRT